MLFSSIFDFPVPSRRWSEFAWGPVQPAPLVFWYVLVLNQPAPWCCQSSALLFLASVPLVPLCPVIPLDWNVRHRVPLRRCEVGPLSGWSSSGCSCRRCHRCLTEALARCSLSSPSWTASSLKARTLSSSLLCLGPSTAPGVWESINEYWAMIIIPTPVL